MISSFFKDTGLANSLQLLSSVIMQNNLQVLARWRPFVFAFSLSRPFSVPHVAHIPFSYGWS
ncbi:hypothetical protein SLEP1_g27264 [Rubroshorea leprosula]|uniref:Uncharacterized protein n=1 Tax=Rubroshorea leprosula TaxID=152421 RepID=A0AAV5K161_9ROSI|nr:hypothetical protein SLEP1_g27264 [Rubroshorea leprosula]